jgi:hypothetical protein
MVWGVCKQNDENYLKFIAKNKFKIFTKAIIHSKKAKSRNRIVGFQDQ